MKKFTLILLLFAMVISIVSGCASTPKDYDKEREDFYLRDGAGRYDEIEDKEDGEQEQITPSFGG